MVNFLRILGRQLFGHNPVTTAVVGSKAVKVPSLGERLARTLVPLVTPKSYLSGTAHVNPAYESRNRHRPRSMRNRCERRKRQRLHKAGR